MLSNKGQVLLNCHPTSQFLPFHESKRSFLGCQNDTITPVLSNSTTVRSQTLLDEKEEEITALKTRIEAMSNPQK